MPIYKIKLIDRKTIAHNTIEFIFEKPTDFTFLPGQYGGFTLINMKGLDPRDSIRRFSLVSAPHDAHLVMTTRIQTSIYKHHLDQLAINDEMKLAGPMGNFTLHDDARVPAVFIAGGIGITPFYSMIRHTLHQGSQQQLILFYGNQRIEDAPYFLELQQLAKHHSNFRFVPTLAQPEQDWQGATGFIDATLLKKHIDHLMEPIYYICGSPNMVNALHHVLKQLHIPEEKIKIEDFPGY